MTVESIEIQEFLRAWHENGRATFERDRSALIYDEYAIKRAKNRRRFIALDRDTSGMFLVERETGEVYSIQGYGVPNRKVGSLLGLTVAYQLATEAGRELPGPGYVREDSALRAAAKDGERVDGVPS